MFWWRGRCRFGLTVVDVPAHWDYSAGKISGDVDNTLNWLSAPVNPTVGLGGVGNDYSWYGADMDEDGFLNELDNCPTDYNPTQDPAVCNGDLDGDLILNNIDNCPTTPNHDQADEDEDGVGDVCDNCRRVSNPGQADEDSDGVGNKCEVDTSDDGVIPVTGSQLLSCSVAEELVIILPDSSKLVVAFDNILCEFDAYLTGEIQDALPTGLPSGASFVNALSYTLMKGGITYEILPSGVKASVQFEATQENPSYTILFWDGIENKWVDLGGVYSDGFFSVKTDHSGVFVLVTK